MSYSILVDPHRAMAALVMDEPLFTLGPVVAADEPEEAQELLQTFVDNLEGDPSQMPTLELMNEWQSFMIAFHGYLQVPEEVAAAQAQAEGAEAPEASQEPPSADPAPDPTVGLRAPEPDAPAPPTTPEDSAGSATQTGEDSTPSPSDTGGEGEQCFACAGAGKHVIEGAEYPCQTCGGSGRLPNTGS